LKDLVLQVDHVVCQEILDLQEAQDQEDKPETTDNQVHLDQGETMVMMVCQVCLDSPETPVLQDQQVNSSQLQAPEALRDLAFHNTPSRILLVPQDHVDPQDPLDKEVPKVCLDHLDKTAKLEDQDLPDHQDPQEHPAEQDKMVIKE